MPDFPCSKCGACCKLAPARVPGWPARPDGACAYLTPDNLCSIYETRPLVCRVDEARPPGVTVERWHALNLEACAQIGGG